MLHQTCETADSRISLHLDDSILGSVSRTKPLLRLISSSCASPAKPHQSVSAQYLFPPVSFVLTRLYSFYFLLFFCHSTPSIDSFCSHFLICQSRKCTGGQSLAQGKEINPLMAPLILRWLSKGELQSYWEAKNSKLTLTGICLMSESGSQRNRTISSLMIQDGFSLINKLEVSPLTNLCLIKSVVHIRGCVANLNILKGHGQKASILFSIS